MTSCRLNAKVHVGNMRMKPERRAGRTRAVVPDRPIRQCRAELT
jgi:hypothetical protein